jgi:hypothetical protein
MAKKTDLRVPLTVFYGLWTLPFQVAEFIRYLREPDIPKGDISDAVAWECKRQGVDPERVRWEEATDPLLVKIGGGKVYKTSQNDYKIELTAPTKITTIRHEIRHISQGHIIYDDGRFSPMQEFMMNLHGVLFQEPPTLLYAALCGSSYKPTR